MPGWEDVDWGSAPSWGALVAAVVAAGFAGRNVRVDQQDRQREQAGKVAAWWGTQPITAGAVTLWGRSGGALVRNSSEVPVYDVEITWLHDSEVVQTWVERVVPPTDEPVFITIVRAYGKDDPHAAEKYNAVLSAVAEVAGGLDVRLTFRDSRDQIWTRWEDGRLTRHKPRVTWSLFRLPA